MRMLDSRRRPARGLRQSLTALSVLYAADKVPLAVAIGSKVG
jgi:hypothetical protein